MASIGIYSYNLNEPKNEFLRSIAAYYFLFTMTVFSVGGSAVFTCKHWPQFDLISQPLMFVFGCSGTTGLMLSVGLNMKSVKSLHLKLQQIVDKGQNEFKLPTKILFVYSQIYSFFSKHFPVREKPAIHEHYWSVEQKCRKYTQNILLYLVPQHVMFVIAILKCSYDIIRGHYDTSAWNLPLHISVPFNTETFSGWLLLLFIQLNISMGYSLTMISVTSYFICCCFYLDAICCHFDMLINTVKKDVENNQVEKVYFKYRKREQQIRKNLHNAIEVHGNVYE